MNIKNDYEALVLALKLSVIADNDNMSKNSLRMAESIAMTLSEHEVKRAMAEADKQINSQ
jgi:hypothetical protein